ncbi:MAG: AAA family ATPase [Chloroflexota bacterium]|nr:AAA family ATPase [Chloroflexota bacterium]
MTVTIAIAGKGGTGKTSISAMLIKLLSERGSVLAIDADPASNLHMALGLPLEDTIGGVREGMLDRKAVESTGIPKPDYLDMKIREAVVESQNIDLLAMGRPEGPGCYCAANNWIRRTIDRIADNYDYVVIDNEAGMEHISRQTTRDVDVLILASDPSIRGITTAARTSELIGEMRTHVERIVLVVNRLRDGLPPAIERAIADAGMELIAAIPEDGAVGDLDTEGRPLIDMPQDSPMRRGVNDIARKLNLI